MMLSEARGYLMLKLAEEEASRYLLTIIFLLARRNASAEAPLQTDNRRREDRARRTVRRAASALHIEQVASERLAGFANFVSLPKVLAALRGLSQKAASAC